MKAGGVLGVLGGDLLVTTRVTTVSSIHVYDGVSEMELRHGEWVG